MGLRDILTGRHEVKGPAPDRLFAISTAYVTLQSEHQIDPAGTAAIVFQALATSEFEATLRDMEEVVKATGGDSGTSVSTEDDSYGYRWMVLRNPAGAPSVEDLAVGINAVSGSIETAGHGERLLCAVFAFADAQKRRDLLHLQLQARLLVPVRARRRRATALDRARAAAQGADGLRTADGAGAGALVRSSDAARSRAAASPCGGPNLVGNQALAGELPAGLLEGQVRRGQDHLGGLELLVADARAVRAHVVEQRAEGVVEAVLAPASTTATTAFSSSFSCSASSSGSRY